ncbi:MAG: PKD domain-containing protein [Nanoarchaeota archaeon]
MVTLKKNYLLLTFIVIVLVLVLTLVLFEPKYTGYVTSSTAKLDLSTSKYSPGQILSGLVNMSYTDIPADAELIIAINDKKYSSKLRDICSGCEIVPASYVLKSTSPVSEAALTFNSKGVSNSYALGFSIQSPDISEAKFSITGNKVDNIYPMLPGVKIKDAKWGYVGPLITGQFEDVQAQYLFDYNVDDEFNVNGARNTEYCEQIDFPASGRYRLDAYVKKSADGANLYASLRDKDKEIVKVDNNEVRCQLTADGNFGWKSCTIDIKPDNYYVCVYADSGSSANTYYKIGVEAPNAVSNGLYCESNDCSIAGFEGYDYFIKIARNKFQTNMSTTESIDFSTELSGASCPINLVKASVKYCLYPIEISTEGKGKINFKMVSVKAGAVDGKLYSIEYMPDTISNGELILELGNVEGIAAPSSEGTYKLKASLEYNGKVYASDEKDINVVKAADVKIIAPQFAGLYQETPFGVQVKNNKSAIARYDWYFGEGQVVTTFEPNVTYTYNTIGDYDVSVAVVDVNELSSMAYATVHVDSAQKNVEYLLNDTKESIKIFNGQLGNASQVVNDIVNILEINTKIENASALLTQYELDYNSALSLTDTEKEMTFGNIQSSLLALRATLPKGLSVEGLTFVSGVNYFDDIPDAITTDINYKKALFAFQEDVNVQGYGYSVNAKYISGRDDGFVVVKKSITLSNPKNMFVVEVIPKEVAGSISGDDIITQGYEIVEADPIIKWPISGSLDIAYIVRGAALDSVINTKTIVLAEAKDIGVEEFEVGVCGNKKCEEPLEDEISCPEDCKKKVPIIPYAILFLILALCIYYINFYKGPGNFKDLTNWISVKLFKRRIFTSQQDLENLEKYIEQTLSQGINEKQIKETLLKKGWSSEQIDYAFRKVK